MQDSGTIVHGTVKHNSSVNNIKITEGNYTGNGTVNRAIPHGLGVVPKIVIISRDNLAIFGSIIDAHTIYATNTGSYFLAVTAFDSTNFYVGNASSYSGSHNGNTEVNNWVAFG